MSATNRGAARSDRDFYPTPDWLTEAIVPTLATRLKRIDVWPPKVYEPAAGELAIVKVLEKAWPDAEVEYSDINPEYVYGNIDFLTADPEPIFDLIISNPPFTYAQEFIDRSKLWRKTPESLIVMMLRVNFLGSQKRKDWFRQLENKPSLSVSPRRPAMALNKHGKLGTDATEYAWFLWPHAEPYIEFLDT